MERLTNAPRIRGRLESQRGAEPAVIQLPSISKKLRPPPVRGRNWGGRSGPGNLDCEAGDLFPADVRAGQVEHPPAGGRGRKNRRDREIEIVLAQEAPTTISRYLNRLPLCRRAQDVPQVPSADLLPEGPPEAQDRSRESLLACGLERQLFGELLGDPIDGLARLEDTQRVVLVNRGAL